MPHGGKGAAVRAGVARGDSDLVVFADADMATPPDQLPLLTRAWPTTTSPSAAASSPTAATCAGRSRVPPRPRPAFHLLASAWVVGPVKDTQCGFKGFTRTGGRDLFSMQKVTSIVFDVEVIFLARSATTPWRSFPSSGATAADRACTRDPASRCRSVGPVPDPADPPPAAAASDRPGEAAAAVRRSRARAPRCPGVRPTRACPDPRRLRDDDDAGRHRCPRHLGYDSDAYLVGRPELLDGHPLYADGLVSRSATRCSSIRRRSPWQSSRSRCCRRP